MDEAAFELPELAFVDRTVTTLATVADDGPRLTVTVFRHPVREGDSLAGLVAQNLRQAAVNLRRHALIERRELAVDGRPAIGLASRWRGASGTVYTRQAHFLAGGTWIILACNADLEDRARCDAVMDRAIETFRFRS
jgi:hypothetical protein